jgi:hypothetical protein
MENYTILDQSIIDNLNNLSDSALLDLIETAAYMAGNDANYDSLEDLRASVDPSVLVNDDTLNFLNQGTLNDRLALIVVAINLIHRRGSQIADFEIGFTDTNNLESVRYQYLVQEQTVEEKVGIKHFANILPLSPEPNEAHDLVYNQGEEM